jgi:hypothetical protein
MKYLPADKSMNFVCAYRRKNEACHFPPPPPPPGRDSDVFSSRGSIALTVQYYSGLLAESWRSTHPPPSSPVMSPPPMHTTAPPPRPQQS